MSQRPLDELEAFALQLPGAFSDMPWEGDVVAKVGKKIFVFLGSGDDARISVKLPDSAFIPLSQKRLLQMGFLKKKPAGVAMQPSLAGEKVERFRRDRKWPEPRQPGN